MNETPVEKIRNIGLMAHIDAGKTTTTERILYYTGVTYKMGEVHEGTALMDWMDQEQERGITITSAATTCQWKDYKINILDTPGHVDFTAEVERSLRILDGGIIILGGVEGVEPQTEKVWYQATKYEVPCISYINKMDRLGADYEDVLNQIEEKLHIRPLLLQLPVGVEDSFKGVIDLVEQKAYIYDSDLLGSAFKVTEIPDEFADEAEMHRDALIETLSDFDMDLMEAYLEKKQVEKEVLINVIRKVTLARELLPVFLGSSFKNKAVQNLLDGVVHFLPSPKDKPPVSGFHPKTKKVEQRELSDSQPLTALVFKVTSDPHVGQLNYIRVYSGVIKSGDTVLIANKNKKVRVSKLLKMHANKREEVKTVHAGDIAATVGMTDLATGDTLCENSSQIILDTIEFPEPVVSAKIEPKFTSDHDKLAQVLSKLAVEDPTFTFNYDKNTGETIISGMGELHLEVMMERMKREFNLQSKIGKPRVAYKETITSRAFAEDSCEKTISGEKYFAGIKLELIPSENADESGLIVEQSLSVPEEAVNAVKSGVAESMEMGSVAGFPVMGVSVKLMEIDLGDDETVNEVAIKIATASAFRKGFADANPILLEPYVDLEVIVPEEFVGDIIGDLNAREARVSNIEPKRGMHVITGVIPLASMFGYATQVRTLSQGRANYSMEFSSYEKMTENKMNDILKKQFGIYAIN